MSEKPVKTNLLFSIDDALKQVGSAGGFYQFRTLMFFCLQWLFGSLILISPIFIFEKPSFKCPESTNITDSDECYSWVCNQPDPMIYAVQPTPQSFVVQYNLICNNDPIADTISTIMYTGSLVGLIICSYIADNKGRKPAIIILWLVGTVGSIMSGIGCNNIYVASIGFALAGSGVTPVMNLHFFYLNEFSVGSFRDYSSSILQLFYPLGVITLSGLAYANKNWVDLVMYGQTIPMILLSFGLFFIYDTPVYFYSRNKEKTVRILNRIAEVNNRPPFNIELLRPNQGQRIKKAKYSFWDLAKYKSLRMTTYCSSVIFFVIQFCYFGSSFALQSIGLDLYSNAAFVGMAEVMGCASTIPFYPRVKRRYFSLIIGLLFSLFFLLFYFVNIPEDCGDNCYQRNVEIAFMALARFFLVALWDFTMGYFTELYPIVIRSIGMGFQQIIGQVASSISSFFVTFSQDKNFNPMIVMGLLGVVCSFHFLLLEETYNQPMKEQIFEIGCKLTPEDKTRLWQLIRNKVKNYLRNRKKNKNIDFYKEATMPLQDQQSRQIEKEYTNKSEKKNNEIGSKVEINLELQQIQTQNEHINPDSHSSPSLKEKSISFNLNYKDDLNNNLNFNAPNNN